MASLLCSVNGEGAYHQQYDSNFDGRRRDPWGGSFYDLGSGVGHVALLGAVLEQLTVFRGVELVRCCRLNADV